MACASVAVCSVSVGAAPSAAAACSSSSSRLGCSSMVRFHVKAAAPSLRPLSRRFCRIVAMASPNTPGELVEQVKRGADDLIEKVKQSISDAQEVCEGNETSEECVVAWDEVEELSAAVAHKRDSTSSSSSKDPLDKYCEDNPETDECRVYED